MAKRKIVNTPADPTLPKTPIEINGQVYNLCFDLGALAEAESALIAEGHDVNLLQALPVLNLSSVTVIFACAIQKFHPEIGYEQATKLITFPTLYIVAGAIQAAWAASLPEPTPAGEEQPAV